MASDTSIVTSAWTPPPTIIGFSPSVDEDTSTITLNWTISTLSDADFSSYQIYRRVKGDSVWTAYAKITDKATTSFDDVLAGQGLTYEYKITQFKVEPGDADLESDDSDIPTATLESDVWFIISADRLLAFEVPVTDGPFSDFVEQEVFEPLSQTRKRKIVARGNVLGKEGQFTAKWGNNERPTAKTNIDYIVNHAGPHIFKSPFGDVWLVEFDAPTHTYFGAGNYQVQMGWMEVDDVAA